MKMMREGARGQMPGDDADDAAAFAEGAGPGSRKAMREPMPALFPRPADVTDIAQAIGRDSFFLHAGLIDAWFIRRSDVLLVTFDNLGSIGEYEPPQPWLQARAAKGGFSILGLIASQRDWYRNEDTPALIRALRDAGFFAGFRRVVFAGASMGGFAALSLSALVPGAVVLAFSPQSTLAPGLVPFERRYPFARRKWDWQSAGCDAAQAVQGASEVWLIYDPFIPEDRAHVRRIMAAAPPGVTREIRLDHLGHRAIRQLKALGLLQDLIEGLASGTLSQAAFAKAFRVRRESLAYQRLLIAAAERRGHRHLALQALRRLAKDDNSRFARRNSRRLHQEITEAEAGHQAETARKDEIPRTGARKAAQKQRDPASSPLTGPAFTCQIIENPGLAAPFSGEIQTLADALFMPERANDKTLASGVLYRDGSWCELSKGWIRALKPIPAPALSDRDQIRDLPGTHLYGGHFRGHFGHFLVESTARLWALDHLGEQPESIVYLPYRGDVAAIEKAIRGQAPFFRLLGIDLPVRTFGEVQRVERLIVPELGFGWLERYAGSPAYRDFMQSRLSAAAPAEGGEKLYVSRARLPAIKGGILGERVIEENLARAGYEIFHPERHPLEVQIARYKAAGVIVALDGSALHLAAYVMPKAGRVAMILRRSSANTADYDLQFRNFADVTPDVINVIVNDWVAGEAARADFRSVGEVDFAALFDRLKALGYLPADFRPALPGEGEVRAMLEPFQGRRGDSFRPLRRGEKHGDEDE